MNVKFQIDRNKSGMQYVALITEFDDRELQEIMDTDLMGYAQIIQEPDVLCIRFKNEELFTWYKLKWL